MFSIIAVGVVGSVALVLATGVIAYGLFRLFIAALRASWHFLRTIHLRAFSLAKGIIWFVRSLVMFLVIGLTVWSVATLVTIALIFI